jgi:hypothetical protein
MAMEESETTRGERCLSFGMDRLNVGGGAYFTEGLIGGIRLTLPAVNGRYLDINEDVAHEMIGVLQHYLHYKRLGTGVDAFREGDLIIGTGEDNKGTIGRITAMSDAVVDIQPISPMGELESWKLPVGKCWSLYSRPEGEAPTAWDHIRKDD